MPPAHAGRRQFAADANRHGLALLPVANEIPTLLLIVIVLLVVAEAVLKNRGAIDFVGKFI